MNAIQAMDHAAEAVTKAWEAHEAARRAFVSMAVRIGEIERAAMLAYRHNAQLVKDIETHHEFLTRLAEEENK